MRRAIRLPETVFALASLAFLALDAQDTPPQGPTFRTGVDVIQLDVTVLDKDRRPIHGLTAADFVVLEGGKPQRIVAVATVNGETRGPQPTARMRHVTHDVAFNDLVDEAGDGRVFAVLIDDSRLPFDSVDIAMAARGAAHYVVDRLGAFDRAAVVYPVDAGRSQDFTGDITKLNSAIDAYDPHARYVANPYQRPPDAWAGGADRLPYVAKEPECFRGAESIPALDALVTRLANIPQRRKTVVFISVAGPSDLKGGSPCANVRAEILKDIFRKAARGNVNIYPVDPSGVTGYQDYLRDPRRLSRAGGPPGGRGGFNPGRSGRGELARRDTLQIMADYTGGRAVVATDAIRPAIDQIFDEDSSYYLLGYQSSNTKADGGFRKIEVKVTRPGATTHTQSGYWAPRKDAVVVRNEETAVATNVGTSSWSRSMLERPAGLFLRANLAPVAKSGVGNTLDIAALVTVRLPPLTRPVTETVRLTRTVYDADGRASTPVEQRATLALQPPPGGEVTYDVPLRFSLPPGRYQVRLHAHSTTADRNGSVFVDLEVPDVTRSRLSLSGIVLGAPPVETPPPMEGLARLLPLIPTTRREFTTSDRLQAFVRSFKAGARLRRRSRCRRS